MSNPSLARCNACKYEVPYFVGDTEAEWKSIYYFPMSCLHCRSVSSVDLHRAPLKCSECRSSAVAPFSDRALYSGDGEKIIADSSAIGLTDRMELTDGLYRCPRCGEFALRFRASQEFHAASRPRPDGGQMVINAGYLVRITTHGPADFPFSWQIISQWDSIELTCSSSTFATCVEALADSARVAAAMVFARN